MDGQLKGVAKIASIQVKDENLQAHLLSPEFFDAERHPEVTFVSKKITRDGDAIEIEGELTIKGITKPATLSGLSPARPSTTSARPASVSRSQTTVDRTQYDINWNMPLPNGEPALDNEVTLKADLSLVAQEA